MVDKEKETTGAPKTQPPRRQVDALLGCPFCGGNNIKTTEAQGVITMDEPEYVIVYCANCGGRTNLCDSEEEAKTAWNRRAA